MEGEQNFFSKICLVSFEIISYQFEQISHKIMTICLIQIGFADDFCKSVSAVLFNSIFSRSLFDMILRCVCFIITK